jgi:hypothetical protein
MSVSVRTRDHSALPPAKLRFIDPMYALAVQNIPEVRTGSMKSNSTATAA